MATHCVSHGARPWLPTQRVSFPGCPLGASTQSWLCGTPLCDYFSHRASSCFHLFMPLSGLRGWHGTQGNTWSSPHCVRSESSRNCSSPPPTQLPSVIYPQDPFSFFISCDEPSPTLERPLLFPGDTLPISSLPKAPIGFPAGLVVKNLPA